MSTEVIPVEITKNERRFLIQGIDGIVYSPQASEVVRATWSSVFDHLYIGAQTVKSLAIQEHDQSETANVFFWSDTDTDLMSFMAIEYSNKQEPKATVHKDGKRVSGLSEAKTDYIASLGRRLVTGLLDIEISHEETQAARQAISDILSPVKAHEFPELPDHRRKRELERFYNKYFPSVLFNFLLADEQQEQPDATFYNSRAAQLSDRDAIFEITADTMISYKSGKTVAATQSRGLRLRRFFREPLANGSRPVEYCDSLTLNGNRRLYIKTERIELPADPIFSRVLKVKPTAIETPTNLGDFMAILEKGRLDTTDQSLGD